ncbi:hypothetical protein OHA59_32950 [Streptomyces sp. NBC_01589]|uniref:hypothetical protein n=1 Tax=Streptomyces sp. NBC_01589 TaxID=2975886 RepID=UPI00386FC7C2
MDDDMTEYLIAFGCYVGEILTRHVGGAWRNDTAAYPTAVPLVVGAARRAAVPADRLGVPPPRVRGRRQYQRPLRGCRHGTHTLERADMSVSTYDANVDPYITTRLVIDTCRSALDSAGLV